MNLCRLSILGGLFLLAMCFLFNMKEGRLLAYEKERELYKAAVESATDDALFSLAEVNNGVVQVRESDAVEIFYHSLCVNLAGDLDGQSYSWIDDFVPVIMVTKPTGVVFYYTDEYNGADGKQLHKVWSETYPYTYSEGGYIVNFNLADDEVAVFDRAGGEMVICTLKEAGDIYNLPVLMSDPDTIRQKTIVETVTKYLEFYVTEHNRIARQHGIKYEFYVPYMDAVSERTIQDISFSVLFQGYPINGGSFNHSSFSAARIRKNDFYYITDGSGGKFYHFYGCPLTGGDYIPEDRIVTDKKEAAYRGAYPCQTCMP